MKTKLRSQDEVFVIAGNDRGKKGKILSVKGDKVVVEGVNVRKKHMRRTQENQKGQIIDMERPIHISNVKPCVGEKAVKLRVKSDKEGKRELVVRDENNKEIKVRSVKQAAKPGKK